MTLIDETPGGRFDCVFGAIIGQAVGDALGAPTESMSVSEIRATYGWIDDFVSDDPAGTDDTEYAVLAAWNILKFRRAMTATDVSALWREVLVGQQGGFYGGGFSEMDAIANLARGLDAPTTGSDNHELWSDGTAMRIGPVGAFCAGEPVEAARLAAIEGSVSHARDGIYCGQAIAASVAAAITTTDWRVVVAAGISAVPDDSWSRRTIEEAVEIGSRYDDVAAALDELHESIAIRYYPWADVAPEATALAYGVFTAARGAYIPSVLGGVNVGRDADTIAAMAGAMAGGLHGASSVPQNWQDQVNIIRGHCISATAGANLRDIAEQIYVAGLEEAHR
jgi:ADP-ribosylglycohydrolase